MSCRKSCCWTPFGVCARAGSCRCHTETKAGLDRSVFDELERARSVREAKGKHR